MTLRERLLARFAGNEAEFEQAMGWVNDALRDAEARGFERAREKAAGIGAQAARESFATTTRALADDVRDAIRAMKDETP